MAILWPINSDLTKNAWRHICKIRTDEEIESDKAKWLAKNKHSHRHRQGKFNITIQPAFTTSKHLLLPMIVLCSQFEHIRCRIILVLFHMEPYRFSPSVALRQRELHVNYCYWWWHLAESRKVSLLDKTEHGISLTSGLFHSVELSRWVVQEVANGKKEIECFVFGINPKFSVTRFCFCTNMEFIKKTICN